MKEHRDGASARSSSLKGRLGRRHMAVNLAHIGRHRTYTYKGNTVTVVFCDSEFQTKSFGIIRVRQRHVGDANPTGTDAGRLGVTQSFLNETRMRSQQLPWLLGWDQDPRLQPAVETCGKFIKCRNQKRCQKWVLESFLELLLALSYIFVPLRLPWAHPRGPVDSSWPAFPEFSWPRKPSNWPSSPLPRRPVSRGRPVVSPPCLPDGPPLVPLLGEDLDPATSVVWT